MITIKTISNITKVDWVNFFKQNEIKKYSAHTSPASFEPLKNFLNETINVEGEPLKNNIDAFIFNKLAFQNCNSHFLFQIQTDFIEKQKGVNIQDLFQQNEYNVLNFNKSFFDDSLAGLIRIFSSKFYTNPDGTIDSIVMVIKVGETLEDIPKNFFVGVTIDFTNNFLSINYSKSTFNNYNGTIVDTLSSIQDYLARDVFSLLNISIRVMNEVTLKRLLFSLYSEMSDKIEARLEELLPENIDVSITDFLNSVNVEFSEKYYKQIISILFQDNGGIENDELYSEGWVFRFVFQEGDYTRASSRTDELDPIYISPIFWNLKELINAKRELLDVGFLWKAIINDSPANIYVRLDVINENICVYYYKKGEYKVNRREKESYVRSKIRRILPR